MKRTLLFAFAVVLNLSCIDDNASDLIPGETLSHLTSNGKIAESMEYEKGRLVKESYFGECDTPYMVHDYTYEAGRIVTCSAASRGVTSSLYGAWCDPALEYERSGYRFEYDTEGRLSLVVTERTTKYYHYDGREIVIRNTDNVTERVYGETVMRTDSRGNIVEISNPESAGGGVTRYEFDNNVNPFYKIGSMKLGGILPYDWSPNNVVKAYDKDGKLLWERKFTYNAKGLPETLVETNGGIYEYHYR
jgi:hypothetical protein